MPTTYSFAFFTIDPFSPPAVNTLLTPTTLNLVDQNDDGFIGTGVGDTVGGLTVTGVYVGDTITVRSRGVTTTITGVTYYRSGGPAVFMASDGTVLSATRFRSSTFVNTSTQYQVGPIPCFAAGTLISTTDGRRRVEDLQQGDLVLSKDHGAQPIRWIGRRAVCGLGEHAPIRFMAGAFGNDRPLQVSPNHRMLISGWRAQLYFGTDEILVAAKHLVNGDTICRAPVAEVTYIHLLFDRHEVIFAEGAATESLHPGDQIVAAPSAMSVEIARIFPSLRCSKGRAKWKTARPTATRTEARLLMVA